MLRSTHGNYSSSVTLSDYLQKFINTISLSDISPLLAVVIVTMGPNPQRLSTNLPSFVFTGLNKQQTKGIV